VSEVSLNDTALRAGQERSRSAVLKHLRLTDATFRWLTRAAVLLVLILLSGVILSLALGSVPAFRAFGFSFVFTEVWNPVTDQFGALAPIYGTVLTSLIAMVIAVPVGVMIAFFLTELCPLWLRRPISIAIELLAGIPSIICGPGSIEQAHKPDEFVTLEQLAECERFLNRVIDSLDDRLDGPGQRKVA
jgi:phosphate transport system permease protein